MTSPTICSTLETLYLNELKRLLAARMLDDYARKALAIVRHLFLEYYELGPTLRANYGIGHAPEELIEFSEKIYRGAPPQLRFSFEAPVPANPEGNRVVSFVNAVAHSCGVELSELTNVIEDATNSWHNFSQTSMFVLFLGFAFQQGELGTSRVYLNLTDHHIQRALQRLQKILSIGSHMELLGPLAALLNAVPRRFISLRGAALTYPGHQRLKLYFEISGSISGIALTKFIEECGLTQAGDDAGKEMLGQLLTWADQIIAIDRPPAWGLALEYGPHSLLWRGGVYLGVAKKSETARLGWFKGVLPIEFRQILEESPLVADLDSACADDPRFRRVISHVAICYDIVARKEVNVYWTLRANDPRR